MRTLVLLVILLAPAPAWAQPFVAPWILTRNIQIQGGDRYDATAWVGPTAIGALQFQIQQGFVGTPSTTPGPVAMFDKIFTLTSCANPVDPICGSTVRISAYAPSATNATQVTALSVVTENNGNVAGAKDTAGISSYAKATNGTGFAIFGSSRREVAGSTAVAAELNVTNVAGSDCPPTDSGAGCHALRLSSLTDSATRYGGAGIILRSFGADNSTEQAFRYGMLCSNNAIKDTCFEDVSNGAHALRARGQSYSQTIDLSGSVVVPGGVAIRLAATDPSGNIAWVSGPKLTSGGYFPSADDSNSLGFTGLRWHELWVTTATVNTISIVATAFLSLGTPADGTFLYCSNCTIANPCAGGGTGALAKRLNGVWVCN